ncbi:MAG: hypothetical protein JKP92_07390 [Alphaproteobacteria bacterium]|nr:hypothetical protein [Alphaproteobacteria bacterium]
MLSFFCALALALPACDMPPGSYPLATGATYHKADSAGTNVQPGPLPPSLGFVSTEPARLEARWSVVAQGLLTHAEREGVLPPPGAGPLALADPREGPYLGLRVALDNALRTALRGRGYRLALPAAVAVPLLVADAVPYARPEDGSDASPVPPMGMAEFALTLALHGPGETAVEDVAPPPSAGVIYSLPAYAAASSGRSEWRQGQ